MNTILTRHRGARPSPDAMTVSEHLSELRRRLIVSVIVFVVAAIVTYFFYPHILTFFEKPYCETVPKGHSCLLSVFGPLDGFGIRLDITGYGGLVLASPVILFQAWRFVTPGLKASEKRYAIPFVVSTVGLFLMGAWVAWITFPHALKFLRDVSGPGIQSLYTPNKYLTLILALMAIFGITFEFPVVLVSLQLAHVLTPQKLAKWRRIAIVVIVIVAAVITPSSDPFSMLALALPMLVFYELSILIGRFLARR